MNPEGMKTTCCVVGGGPAGVMLGYLLARNGVQVTVLEKHKDFFRDFRGDTVHPSTLQVLHELGLLEEFLKLPHQEITSAGVILGSTRLPVADFRHVPARAQFIALMPQWDFLNFLASHAKALPTFRLLMAHEATDLLWDGERVAGVKAKTADGEVAIRADLVVGCDGRHPLTRKAAGLEVMERGVPIDVLWFRISRRPDDPAEVLGNVNYGKALILINRSDYFQAGMIVAKGSFEDVKAQGLDAFQESIRRIAPYLEDRVKEIADWEQVKVLTVQINRLRRWHRPGLLCIGDAAHAMSPAGGVGVNLAIQDAVATANLLSVPLRAGTADEAALRRVQRRREFPTRVTQAVQALAHRGFERVFEDDGPMEAPWQLRAFLNIPGIHRVLGYAVGMGARPEHVQDVSGARRDGECARRSQVRAAAFTGAGVLAGAALGWCAWRAWHGRGAAGA